MIQVSPPGGSRLLCLLLAVYPAFSQTGLSLRQAVEQAIQSHPALIASTERIQVATGLRRQAQLRINPRLTLQTENWHAGSDFAPSHDTDNFLYLTQLFETGKKRELRTSSAQEALRRSELERELLSRRIATAVKASYWRAAVSARVRDLLKENLNNFQQIVEFHQIRVREGAMPEADLLRVQLESERLSIEANTATLEADRTRIQLFREMGLTEFPETTFTENPEETLKPMVVDIPFALENRPETKIARQMIEQARAQERLQRANAKPDVEASFGLKRTGGINTMMGIVQVPLPFVNRNEGAIAAATAETRMAQSELAAANALVQAEVRSAATEVEVRRKQVTETFRGLLDRATESSRIARAAYREGGWDLLRLLDAERTRIELQVLYFRTLSDYHQSVVALENAMGVNP